MIQRRQFIGSLAGLVAISQTPGILAGDRLNVTRNTGLNWHCSAIQTIARDQTKQPPVVTGVSIQPDGKLIAVVGDDHVVSLLDIETHEFVAHLNRHRDWVRSARFSPSGNVLFTAGNDSRILRWDMDVPGKAIELANQPEAIIEVAVHPAGTQLATVGFDNQIRIYDTRTNRQLLSMTCPCNDMNAVAFSTDGAFVAAGGRTGTIRVWETPTGRQVADLTGQRRRVRSIEFAQDNKLVSVGDDCIVRIDDPGNVADSKKLTRHGGKLFVVKILDESRLATAGSDDLIHVWDIDSLEELESLSGHTGTVSCLDYQTNVMASGSYDTQIRIWETQRSASLPPTTPSRIDSKWNQQGLIK